jgi:hypothetical protein
MATGMFVANLMRLPRRFPRFTFEIGFGGLAWRDEALAAEAPRAVPPSA